MNLSPLDTFLSLIDCLHEGVIVLKDDGEIVKMNEAFIVLFRLNRKEIPPDYSQIFQEKGDVSFASREGQVLDYDSWPFIRVCSGDKIYNEILQVIDKKKSKRWYGKFSSSIITLDNQDYCVINVLDVTEDHHPENKLMQANRVMKDIIDSMPVMITIYDPEFKHVYLNKAVKRITGWTNEDVKRKNFLELAFPERESQVHMIKFLRSLKPGFKDVVMRTKDGKNIDTSWANIKLVDGRQVGIGLDINKQRKAEKTIKESEERFRNLADNISQLAWMTDHKGNVFWFNKRWYDYTGTRFRDVKGYGWSRVYHPDHVQRVLLYFQECIRMGKVWEDTFPIRKYNGEYRWFLSRALPIRDRQGKITRWFGTNTDITEIQNLQKDLIEANAKVENAMQLQKTFIQNISHEVRTPMNSILGFTELLARTINEGEEKSFLDSIDYSGKLLLSLIDDIIDFSRLDSHDLNLTKEMIPLKKIFDHLKKQFQALLLHFKKAGIELIINIRPGDEEIQIHADQYRLQQVMNNLISNAVKYTEKGSVEIGYRIQETDVVFYVKDTGIGIKEEHRQTIFKRFQQTEQDDTKNFKGTGLGLAICKHLVQLFGGELWFESEEREGSCFYFTYPTDNIVRNNVSLEKIDTIDQITPELLGKTILIVEDDDFSFRLMEAMLSDTKAKILHAETGTDAVTIFNSNKIDLVFLDIRLPGMNGYEVLKNIREKDKAVPVIAQSAHAMPEELKKSMDTGFDYHATKPISFSMLYSVINKFLPADVENI